MAQAWVKNYKEFSVFRAPRGIRYKKLSAGTSFQRRVEVDYVPVPTQTGVPAHAHKRAHTLCFVLSGEGYVELNGRRVRLRAGDVVHIPAGVCHEFRASSRGFAFLSVQHPPIGKDYSFGQDTGRYSAQ